MKAPCGCYLNDTGEGHFSACTYDSSKIDPSDTLSDFVEAYEAMTDGDVDLLIREWEIRLGLVSESRIVYGVCDSHANLHLFRGDCIGWVGIGELLRTETL